MSYEVKSISIFEKQAKRLVKKYPSLKNELLGLIRELKERPDLGTPLGYDCYKIRLGIRSKGKGKSGGGRVITCVKVQKENIFLLSIFDKSKQATISDKELKELLQLIPD